MQLPGYIVNAYQQLVQKSPQLNLHANYTKRQISLLGVSLGCFVLTLLMFVFIPRTAPKGVVHNNVQNAKAAPEKNDTGNALSELNKNLQIKKEQQEASSTAKQVAGPTLGFSLEIEGRPKDDQSATVFLGIAEGDPQQNPKFVLSYTVDVPQDGSFNGINLPGLKNAAKYTAYIKGAAQIDVASSFTLKPVNNVLNNNRPIKLLSGDLNEDNVINDADLAEVQKAAGAVITSPRYNSLADFNLDQLVNYFDVGVVRKNLGKTGASGVWSSEPEVQGEASPSARTINQSVGTPAWSDPAETTGGYWIWVSE